MEKMIAFRGLLCHECGAFLATKNDDDKKRQDILAKLYSTASGSPFFRG